MNDMSQLLIAGTLKPFQKYGVRRAVKGGSTAIEALLNQLVMAGLETEGLTPVANTAAIAAQHNPHFMAKSPVCRRDHDLLSGHPP